MRSPYVVIAVGTLAAVGGVLAVEAISPESLRTSNTMRVEDFGAYWTATKANMAGSNAFEQENLLALQQQIEPNRTEPIAAWSPPWTFAAFAPLAPLDFAAARWIWRFIQIGTTLLSVTALWRVYGGLPERLIWMWFAALAWYPSLQALGLGQHSTLVLLGVAGWVACLAARRPFAAGCFLSLTLVKPQNVYLVGLIAIVWVLDRRQWRAAAGGLVGAAVLSAAAAAPNPAVFEQYVAAITSRPPTSAVPPTLGMLLRVVFGERFFWLSFLPTAAGFSWAVWYYARHRATWDWAARGPLVVLVSCLTSPYGWVYDQVLFLIPAAAVLAAMSHRPNGVFRGVAFVVALTVVCLSLHGAGYRELAFVWLTPLCLALYLAAGLRPRSPNGILSS
jgi:hypothetical protein